MLMLLVRGLTAAAVVHSKAPRDLLHAADAPDRRLVNWCLHDEIVSDYAARLDQLSCLYWDADHEMSGDAEYMVSGGYGQVLGALRYELELRGRVVLGATVSAVSYAAGGEASVE